MAERSGEAELAPASWPNPHNQPGRKLHQQQGKAMEAIFQRDFPWKYF
jgi:hypothetical protein